MVRFGAVANSIPAAISTIRPMATTARKSLSICANAGRVWAFLLDHRRQKLLIRKLIRKQTHARSPMPPLALQSDGGCAGVFSGPKGPRRNFSDASQRPGFRRAPRAEMQTKPAGPPQKSSPGLGAGAAVGGRTKSVADKIATCLPTTSTGVRSCVPPIGRPASGRPAIANSCAGRMSMHRSTALPVSR